MELNMNIEERAAKYAAERANKVFADALAEAYKDGYRDGYNDHKANPMVELVNDYDEVEYVDLGLPSGTLWSKDYLRKDGKIVYLPFCEAIKLMLPTEEQWKELRTYCCLTWLNYDPEFDCSFTSWIGEGIRFRECSSVIDGNGFYLRRSHCLSRFWLNGKITENNGYGRTIELTPGAVSLNSNEMHPSELRSEFIGNRVPIRLIKHKNNYDLA